MSFEFPQMFLNCPVVVSNDPSRSDNFMGLVTAVKGLAIDVAVITNDGISLRRDVWHEDDPRCIQHPDHFQDNISGVFRLGEGEIQRRQLFARLDALEARLAGMAAEVRRLSEQVAPQPKRGRGRPPNPKQPELASV